MSNHIRQDQNQTKQESKKMKNKLITIGGINSNISYLNISIAEASFRYNTEWAERGCLYPPELAEISEHEFNDSFTFEDIN